MSGTARFLILYLIVTVARAQDLGRDALRRTLEAERTEHLKQKSIEEAQRDPAKPFERKRDARACEAARIAYQGYCGSPVAPRWRNPRCRDAEISLLYSC